MKVLGATLTGRAAVLWGIAVLSALAFFTTVLSWGGSALNGQIENERYYLQDSGEFNEVTRGQYIVSAALSLVWPPALLFAAYFWIKPNLSSISPKAPELGKLLTIVLIFSALGAAVVSISSLACLVKAFR